MEAEDSANTAAPRGATLSRLAIRGIRSFGPDEEQVIRFDKPLTVISGQNGAGKTTVLECLKYATTGQLPPGANNGQGFVHDPKMAGVTEVKAEVKLLVQTRASERRAYFVSRKMKLTQRRTKLEFKQLEGLLKMKDRRTGKEETMSGKCSDLDRMVPLFMGVSSAILQSVIFCHQEESSWPLQESSVLKKKFDDIFDSTRYSKALDEVKKQKKRLTEVFRTAESRKNVLEVHRKQAGKYTDQRNELLEEISTLQASLVDARTELTKTVDRVNDLQDKLEQTQTIRTRLVQQKTTYEAKREALRELRDKIGSEVLKGNQAKTTEEIDTQRKQVRAKLASYEEELTLLKVNLADSARELKTAEAAVHAAQREETRLQEQQRQHAESESRLLRELHVAVVKEGAHELARRLKGALDAPPSSAAATDAAMERRTLVDEALAHVRARAQEAGTALESRSAALDAQRDEVRSKLAEVRSQVSSIETNVRNLRGEEAGKLAQLQEIQDEMSKLDTNYSTVGSRVAQLDQQIAGQSEALKALEASMEKDDPKAAVRETEAEIATLTNKVRDATDKIEQLEEQHDQVQDYRRLIASARDEQSRHAGIFDDVKRHVHGIHLYEEELADDAATRLSALEQSVQKSLSDRHDEATTALESSREAAEGVAADLGTYAAKTENALASAEKALQDEGLKIAKYEQEKSAAEASLEAAHKELAGLAAPRLPEAVQARLDAGESEDAVRKALEERVQKVQGDYYDFVAAADYLNTVLEKLSRQPEGAEHACPACMRPIGDEWANEISARNKKALQNSLPSLVLAGDGESGPGHVTRDVSWRSQKHKGRCMEFAAQKDLGGYDMFRCMLILQRELSLDEGDGSRKARLLKAKESAEQDQKTFEKAVPILQMRARINAQMTKNEESLRTATAALSAARSQQATLEAQVQSLRSGKLEPAVAARDAAQALLESCHAASRHAAKAGELGLSSAVEEQAVQAAVGESPLQAARLAREEIENQLQAKRADKERLQGEWQRKQARLQRTQTQLADLRNRRIEMREQSQRFEELSKRKQLVQEERQKFVDRIARETKAKSAKADEVQKQESALAALEAQRKDELSKLQRARAALDAAVSSANGLVAQIDPAKLAETEAGVRSNLETLRAAQREAEKVVAHIKTKEGEANEQERNIAELQEVEAQLDDIARFYRDQADLAETKKVRASLMSELKEKLDGQESIEDEKRALEDERRTLERKEASLASRVLELERQCSALESQLQGADYKNIEDRYRASYIEARTTKMAAADLDKYYKALDTALMQFHSMKIEEINRRIAELWGVMYCGGDIDRIEIRSEGKTTATRRSYNYRVVMTKGDTQLDMRGRCSAGQRVMAALVIRMALAETFSINCGILSVDEPTVNLDEPNKVGLANALAQVLKLHRDSRFFQLILITHDQDFVDRIAEQVHNLDMEANYYNVERHINPNTNKYVSRIAPLYPDDDHRSVAN